MKAYIPKEWLDDLSPFIGDSIAWFKEEFISNFNIRITKIIPISSEDFKITLEDGKEFYLQAKVVNTLKFYIETKEEKNGNK